MEKNFKTLAKRSENLLKDAQAVFGEILVVDAWLLKTVFDTDTKEKRAKILSEDYERLDGESIDIGGICVMIEFCNGRKVAFSSSEWGGMGRPDIDIEFV